MDKSPIIGRLLGRHATCLSVCGVTVTLVFAAGSTG
jgi:hypothetical protein